jgi:hypothetical protein
MDIQYPAIEAAVVRDYRQEARTAASTEELELRIDQLRRRLVDDLQHYAWVHNGLRELEGIEVDNGKKVYTDSAADLNMHTLYRQTVLDYNAPASVRGDGQTALSNVVSALTSFGQALRGTQATAEELRTSLSTTEIKEAPPQKQETPDAAPSKVAKVRVRQIRLREKEK